jgi:hypothetical protein
MPSRIRGHEALPLGHGREFAGGISIGLGSPLFEMVVVSVPIRIPGVPELLKKRPPGVDFVRLAGIWDGRTAE